MGPVQVLVVRFEHPRFAGEALAELSRLGDNAIVRLVDVLLLERSQDGSFETLAPPEGVDSQLGSNSGAVAAAVLGDVAREAPADGPGPTPGSSWSLADVVPPGSLAAVALIEHVWAQPLVAAVHHAGGELVEETWLAPQDRAVLEGLLA